MPPLVAHYQEPRFGVRKEMGTARMKLDIGDAIDLVEVAASDSACGRIRAGADFFTYALTSNWQGHRLQVDAVDGFFGGHIVFAAPGGWPPLTLRLRILHLSAHFVDGHYDFAAREWLGGMNPVPFTKDFGELTGLYAFRVGTCRIQAYSGLSYATLVRPSVLKRISTLHGVQLDSGDWAGSALGRPLTLYAADDFTLAGVPSYVGTNNVEFGARFGEPAGQGVKIYLSYFSGLNIFSQYFNVRWDQWGIGFAFDIW